MNTVAAPITEPIVISAYEALRTDIAIAVKSADGKVFNYRDPKENKLCRSYLHGLRLIRGKIEGARKAAKVHALEYGRRVDSLAKEMEVQVDALITPHETIILDIETEEKARIAKHTDAIHRIVLAQVFYAGKDSKTISEALEKAKAIITDDMEEFKARADAELAKTILALESELAIATKREAEAEELAKLRAEAAARAESDRIAKIQTDAVEAERRRAQEADAKRIADEQASAARAEKAAKEAQEKAAAAAKAKVEAAKLAEEKAKRQAAEAKEREAKIKAELIAANERERVRMEAAAQAKVAAEKAERENREAMTAQITEDISLAGSNAREIAEAIMAGMIRNVRVDWN